MNAYVDLCLAVQAVRREFEGLRTPLATAIGVAASVYTHQLANAYRVLTDVRVRHLLADEVGLGKTVQALMILNALRYQRRDLQALVIVPDRLVTQWRDEILTRAHSAPLGEEAEMGEGQYIRLAWEAQLGRTTEDGIPEWSLGDIDSDRYQVLVVDELHRLRSDVQDRVVRQARAFEHVLVLTATPAFRDVKRHAQLFALLEPERTAVARASIRDDIPGEGDVSGWSEQASRSVVERILERDRIMGSACSSGDAASTALMHCAYRRVIRTRRADYGGVLPSRQHIPLLIEPLAAEAERQLLMWRYFNHLGNLGLEIDPTLLAKRVILSPPSLEQRVDFFRRGGQDREGLLERVKPLVHRSQGDSRADALVDLLTEIWTHDTSERVLVACQDNLTVDYLFDLVRARLPEIGPLEHRIPLVASRIRQGMMTKAIGDLGGAGNETNENLEAFQRGQAHILFAPEAAQVGLNLQCARVLVLYSVPWRPEEVEQWIGRLDRIGNPAAFTTNGEARAIDIYTIAQRGLIDEKVVMVLQRFQTFERGVNLDGTRLEYVAKRIENAALQDAGANWGDLENATEAMAAEDKEQELESALHPHLPWSVEWATALRQYLNNLPPAQIVLNGFGHPAQGPGSWDRAMEGMVKLLKRAAEYHFRWNQDSDGWRFQTLWYRFGDPGMHGYRPVCSRVVFTFGADPTHEHNPRFAHAFITRRTDIDTPPRRHVTMKIEEYQSRRPLRFLNFGNALHDELVEGWLPDPAKNFSVDVTLFGDHQFFEHGEPGLHVLRISVLDPAMALECRTVEQDALNAVETAAGDIPPEYLMDLMAPFQRSIRCAIEADHRWLRGQLTAEFRVEGMRLANGQMIRSGADEISLLLNPMAHQRQGVPRAADWQVPLDQVAAIKKAMRRLRETDAGAAGMSWSNRFPEFDCALETRRRVVQEEGRDAQALAELELSVAEVDLDTALDRGNRAQITRTRNLRNRAAAKAAMTRTMWEQRDGWLQGCTAALRGVQPKERVRALLRVRREH